MLQPCRKAAVKTDVCDRGGLVAESGEDLQCALTPSLAAWLVKYNGKMTLEKFRL